MKERKGKINYFTGFKKINKLWILVILLLLVHIFLRFYNLENRMQFNWDQVDNAWAAKNIIVDHKYPLVGVAAKQNSGIYLGPAYYYYITPFYYLFNLDPIASGVIAGVTSVITFFVLFLCIKKIFSFQIALVALFIHTFSFYIISLDKVQWQANFIVPLSMLLFYCLIEILNGKEKYILFLAALLGLLFHIHLTAIFFLIIVFLTLPLFPRTKKTLVNCLLGIPIFLLWFIPNMLAELQTKGSNTHNFTNYINGFYHGIHARRILQLQPDAFIEFEGIMTLKFLKPLELPLLIFFYFIYLYKNFSRKRKVFCYLVALWIVVPWIAFSTYSGEISNYYFSSSRPIVLMILSYSVVWIFTRTNIVLKLAFIFFGVYYVCINMNMFFQPFYQPLSYHKRLVQEKMKRGEKIEFQQGMPESYIYYIYTHNAKTK